MFRGDPWVDQEKLRRRVLNALDPRLTRELLIDAGTQAAMQMEDQAQEISIMLLGFPAEVRETDDHLHHIQSGLGFLQRRIAMSEPVGPEFLVLIHQHLAAHTQAAAKGQKEKWAQAQPQIVPQLQMLAAAAQQAQVILQQQAVARQQQQMAAPPLAPAPAQAPAQPAMRPPQFAPGLTPTPQTLFAA
jgi:hypothetical protein